MIRSLSCALLLVGVLGFSLIAAEKPGRNERPPRAQGAGPEPGVFHTDVPSHLVDVILGRITDSSITISVLCQQDLEGVVSWEREKQTDAGTTAVHFFRRGDPTEIRLDALRADTAYRYRVLLHKPGSREPEGSVEGSFHTARPPGTAFTFTITADSHLDANASPSIYQATLACARADAPDFHIDLGDTFMTEKRRDFRAALPQYLAQRHYLGQLSRAAPLFLVLGNHDGESGGRPNGPAEPMSTWSCLTRKRYFPNPEPDSFYLGNTHRDPNAGALQDYYAWTWGDALFVVLDPYWYSQRARRGDSNWSRTLGREQYDWLAHTLEGSRARFKFIFIHQLVGGLQNQGRGGAEAAPFFEWGGNNPDGSDGFAEHRPGWPMPIHSLLLKHHVTAVFHGHDHFYAQQEHEGIIYQEVPQPGYAGNGRAPRSAPEYGYQQGVILGSPGYLRVAVSPGELTVTFVRAGESASVSKPSAGVVSYVRAAYRPLVGTSNPLP